MRLHAAAPVLALLAWAVTSACGGGSGGRSPGIPGDPGGDGGDGDAGGQTWILGDWEGTYENKSSVAGAGLKETTAQASFVETDKGEGTFAFTFPTVKDLKVAGTYRDFAQKSLLLSIKESNLSAIGLAGVTTSFDYDLVGSALELGNDRVNMKLVRTGGGGGGSDPGSDPEDADVRGLWACQDSLQHDWRLNIRAKDAFTADIYATGTSAAAIRMDGTVVVSDELSHSAALEVTWANVDDYIGLKLKVALTSDGALDVTRLATDGGVADTWQCERSR